MWEQIGNDINGQSQVDFTGADVDLSGSGNTLIVTSPDYYNLGPGAVRVYNYFNGEWVQIGETIYGETNTSNFSRVAINGEGSIFIIGAPNSDEMGQNSESGSVRIYGSKILANLEFRI